MCMAPPFAFTSFIAPTTVFDVVVSVLGFAPMVFPIQLSNELNVFIYMPLSVTR